MFRDEYSAASQTLDWHVDDHKVKQMEVKRYEY